MKKKLWAPLIIAALLLLYGCSTAEAVPALAPAPTAPPMEALVPGRWVCADVEVTEDFAALLPTGEVRFSEVCDLPDVYADLELYLAEDGDFTLAYSEEDGLLAAEIFTGTLQEGLRDYLLDAMGEVYMEAGMKPEAVRDVALLESAMAMTLEELYEQMGLYELSERWERHVSEGRWRVEGGVLLLNDAEAAYDTAADTITFDGRVYTRK